MQYEQLIEYARRQANVSTDIDKFQWLVIVAALESAQSAGGTSPNHHGSSPTAAEPARGRPVRRQPQVAQQP